MKRAERRHHLKRMKAKARRIAAVNGWPRIAERFYDVRTPCSCWMCGNPRRYLGEVTMQERKFIVAASA